VFWVISVYFNIRNTLLKSGIFLLGHPVYTGWTAIALYKKELIVETKEDILTVFTKNKNCVSQFCYSIHGFVLSKEML